MLIENQLQVLPLDGLLKLLRIKIEEINMLRDIADHKELLEVVDEIMLIQKAIDEKNFENSNRPVKGLFLWGTFHFSSSDISSKQLFINQNKPGFEPGPMWQLCNLSKESCNKVVTVRAYLETSRGIGSRPIRSRLLLFLPIF